MRLPCSLLLVAIALQGPLVAADGPVLGNADTDAWGKHVAVGDGIFPATSPAAAQAFSFNATAFLDHGKPSFVASASIHYPRVPRDLWEDRLLRLKRLGYTWIETYAFWNYHETVEGRFDFTGEKDLGAFLALCHRLGFRVLVRVGPYVCAEWNEGGFPTWLRTRTDMRLRVDDPRYLEALDRWFGALLPVVAQAQIHRGGGVAMLQLENEHPHGGGTSANEHGKAYFGRMRALAAKHGIEVPTFFSGLHHSHDPAGDKPWSVEGRQNPWMSTEFWTTWYSDRGPSRADVAQKKSRAMWKMVAFGAGGFNCYMAHGGTSFGAWNNNEVEATYDFGAPLGQVGDLRPLGHRFREAMTFASTCADLLLTPERTTAGEDPAPGVRRWERTSVLGTVAFLDNPSERRVRVDLGAGGSLRLEPGEIAPVLHQARIDERFVISSCGARVLARLAQGRVTTLVVRVGDEDAPRVVVRAPGLPEAGTTITLTPGSQPQVQRLTAGDRSLQIVAVPAALADRTWVVNDGPEPVLVVGSGFPRRADATTLVAEPGGDQAWVVTSAGPVTRRAPTRPATGAVPLPGAWQAVSAAGPAAPAADDQAWESHEDPVQLGLAGGTPIGAWYRTTITRAEPATGVLRLPELADFGQVYLNGKLLGQVDRDHDQVPVSLEAGRHQLAIYASLMGRDKLFFHTGVFSTSDRKGMWAPPRLLVPGTAGAAIEGWRYRPLDGKPSAQDLRAETTGEAWKDVAWGQDPFGGRPGRVLAIARMPAFPAEDEVELRFPPVDDEAEVWVNGQRIGHHKGWRDPFTMAVPAKALSPEGNVVAVVVINSDGAGGMSGQPGTAAWRPMPGTGDGRVRGWRQQDIADVPPVAGYGPLAQPSGMPAYYRTTLTVPATQDGMSWRLSWGGLGRGQVWLNGHALGRFPDHLDQRGLWMPPCWLKAGANDLVIYDELGQDPAGVRAVVDAESPGAAQTWR